MRFKTYRTLLVLIPLVVATGCFRRQSQSAARSAQTRQAKAVADKEEEQKFRDEQGNTDWRGRVDAAKEALEKAKSDYNWGKQESALERALAAARLLPPPGKDFSLPELKQPAGEGEAQGQANGGEASGQESAGQASSTQNSATKETPSGADNQSAGGSSGQSGFAGGGNSDGVNGGSTDLVSTGSANAAEQGNYGGVTNEEVKALRASLEKLFQSMEGGVSQARGNVTLDRHLIEIE